MFQKIFNYFNDGKLKIIYFSNKLDIINYDKIIDFSNKEIKLLCSNKIIIINGNNLSINKLYNEELLITGSINNVVLGEDND